MRYHFFFFFFFEIFLMSLLLLLLPACVVHQIRLWKVHLTPAKVASFFSSNVGGGKEENEGKRKGEEKGASSLPAPPQTVVLFAWDDDVSPDPGRRRGRSGS
jgi:hypothetical protein